MKPIKTDFNRVRGPSADPEGKQPFDPTGVWSDHTSMGYDQIYYCQMPGQVFGVWPLQGRLRIFQPHAAMQMVVITNMGIEMEWFIPYRVEKLADQIVREFRLDPGKLVWIEHYTYDFRKPTCADLSQVTFEWRNGKATNPRWTPIAPEMAQTFMSKELLPA